MHRVLTLTLAVGLLLASCGDDDAGSSTTTAATTTAATTTSVATTTVPETTTPTTTTTTTTTTTVAPTTTAAVVYGVVDAHVLPVVFGVSGAPNGSGCVVAGDVLPDGVWMGFAEAYGGGVITFDLACYFSGDAANAAAAADLGPGVEAEEGFYIRNQNPKVFAVRVASSALVYSIDAAGPTWFPEPYPLASWPNPSSWLTCPGDSCAVWLYVNGGVATAIVEQFLP